MQAVFDPDTLRLDVSRKVNVCLSVLWSVCCFLVASKQLCERCRNLSACDDSLSRIVLQGLTRELVLVGAVAAGMLDMKFIFVFGV